MEDIERINEEWNGVYGLFRYNFPVYIGTGNIRGRLIAHLNGDNPCITKHAPDLWTAEVFEHDPEPREVELLREYNPVCNRLTSL